MTGHAPSRLDAEAAGLPRGEPVVRGGRYLLYPYGLYLEEPPHTPGDAPLRIPLTNFGAQIVGETTRDDGSGEVRKIFDVAATVKGRALQASLPAQDYSGMGWVAQAFGAEAILSAGTGLRDCAREAIQQCSPKIVHRYVYEHTGWRVIQGTRCYLHNGGVITAEGLRTDISVELTGGLGRYELPIPPTGDACRAAILASLALRTLLPEGGMLPVLGTVYLAPLRELLAAEAPDFTLWVYGRSGLFKSEIAALAQSHWGAFTRMTLPASFVATANALERLTFATKDALLVCDDYFPARNKREADSMGQTADRLLRGVGNGSGRPRMRHDTTLRPDLPPRGVTLATGERLPEGHSTNARLFLLPLAPTTHDTIVAALTAAQQQTAQYALAMSAYIQWIAQHWEMLQATLLPRFRALRQRAYAAESHTRQAAQVAHLALAWDVFTRFAVDAAAMDAATRDTLLEEVWTMLTTAASQQGALLQHESPEHRFLALLSDGFASKRAYLENLNGDCPLDGEAWGWVRVTRQDKEGDERLEVQRPHQGTLLGHTGEEWLYLFPEQTYQFLAKAARDAGTVFPVELNTLLKHLADRQLIATAMEQGERRLRVRQRIGTGNPRVIKLRKTAFEDVFPVLPGTNVSPGTPPGTEQPIDSPGSYDDFEGSVPGVPGSGDRGYVRARDARENENEFPPLIEDEMHSTHGLSRARDSLLPTGNIGNTGNNTQITRTDTSVNGVPGPWDPPGTIGNNREQPGSSDPSFCPRCETKTTWLIREGGQVCYKCKLVKPIAR